ncbi:MAG: AMP-binding protein [Pseudomonadales bacterium]
MNNSSPLVLANIIAQHCQQNAELDALTFVHIAADGNLKEELRSYQQLWDNGQHIAAALDDEGMQAGDSFGLLMKNHPEFVDAMVGASITNTVFVPIDPRTKGEKLSYMLNFAECRGVIVADYALENLLSVLDQQALSSAPEALACKLEWVWVLETDEAHGSAAVSSARMRQLSDIYAGPIPAIAVRVCDPAGAMQMLFTSGTTGDPKAIVAPHSRFGGNATLGELFGLRAGDRPYTGLSLTHANAQIITLGMGLYMGLRTVVSRQFTKSRLWDITRHYGCTSFNLLGGMTNAIYSEPARPDDDKNPVRFVLSAGMPANLWQAYQQRFNVDIFEFYGSAEGGITINPPGDGPIGSIGKPLPAMEARIVDENDQECAANEHGEIVFRGIDGQALPVNYFKNAAASKQKNRAGWLRMGDIGYRDEQGWFYFLYRKGGGIRRNGDFIDPAPIEKKLAEHTHIADVFVYGVAAASGAVGEKDIVAAIVIDAKVEFNSAGLFDYCRQNLPANAIPSYLQLVDDIPKTASEKPLERVLLEQFSAPTATLFTQ